MKEPIDLSRVPLMLTVCFCGVAAVIYLLCVASSSDALDAARRERDDLEFQLTGVMRDLRGSNNVRERLAALGDAFCTYEAGMLTPLLGSWAMRAKALFDPLADGAGLKNVEFVELPSRALPLTKPVPMRLMARRPVKMTCRGSYAAIVSFMLRVERDFPLVSEESFRIAAGQDAADQVAEIVFEWPVEGALSAPPKAQAKGPKGGVAR